MNLFIFIFNLFEFRVDLLVKIKLVNLPGKNLPSLHVERSYCVIHSWHTLVTFSRRTKLYLHLPLIIFEKSSRAPSPDETRFPENSKTFSPVNEHPVVVVVVGMLFKSHKNSLADR